MPKRTANQEAWRLAAILAVAVACVTGELCGGFVRGPDADQEYGAVTLLPRREWGFAVIRTRGFRMCAAREWHRVGFLQVRTH
jgi:hypothetical protein